MKMYKVEPVTAVKSLILGEGPHWDIPTQTLYFVDIVGGSIHSYKPSTDEHHSAVIGDGSQPVSLIIPVEGAKDKFVISVKNDLCVIEWDGKSSATSEPKKFADLSGHNGIGRRINDGKADAKGRIWAGTMNLAPGPDGDYEPNGTFYKICPRHPFYSVKSYFSPIHISNGLTWSPDNRKFYYIDSGKYRVDRYGYYLEMGELSTEKTVFDFKENDIPGLPDGMTIDSEGKLFVANFGGGQVLKIDPDDGKILEKIAIPAKQTTSVAFGGANLDELYVTSANLDTVTRKPGAEDGVNGCLYKITNLGVTGLPMFNANLDVSG